MLDIRKATVEDYPRIIVFYYNLIDEMENSPYRPLWEKEVYPSPEMLKNAIAAGEMYMGFEGEKCASCMIANHSYNEGYKKIHWNVDAADGEFFVIHALGVAPDCAGRGLAKEMVRFVIALARANGAKAVRLDTLEGNVPAERAYTKIGFKRLDMISMFYPDTGWMNFTAFEYVL